MADDNEGEEKREPPKTANVSVTSMPHSIGETNRNPHRLGGSLTRVV